MSQEVPEFLKFSNDVIEIGYRQDCEGIATDKVIWMKGTKKAFLTLANVILFQLNNLVDNITLTRFPFIKLIDINNFEILVREECQSPHGQIEVGPERTVKWTIAEDNLSLIAGGQLHSLGYANDHAHIDEGMKKEDVSIYCVVTGT